MNNVKIIDDVLLFHGKKVREKDETQSVYRRVGCLVF